MRCHDRHRNEGAPRIGCPDWSLYRSRHPRSRAARAAVLEEWRARTAEFKVTESLDDVIAWRPELVLEGASQTALAALGSTLIERGIDVAATSIGALAMPDVQARLENGPGRFLAAPGAIGGLDVLAAAKLSGLTSVTYTARKPFHAWGLENDGGNERHVLFQGSARDAALRYPQNANVAATIALAGLGFDATRVTLLADAKATGNTHEIVFTSACVDASLTLRGVPTPDNPKTSLTAGYSLAHMALTHASWRGKAE